MKTVSHRALKRQEARQRSASILQARRSIRVAKRVQRQVSLVGSGAKWRITNLRQVARAMAAWSSTGVRFPLEQFSEVFRIRDATGRPHILVGGPAVNYWAQRYLSFEPDLRELQPFTSVDIDFRGNREDVQRIAGQLQATPVYPAKVAITALAGAVPFSIGGTKSNIEIVRRVPGLSATAIEALDAEVRAEQDKDRAYWAPLKPELEAFRRAEHEGADTK